MKALSVAKVRPDADIAAITGPAGAFVGLPHGRCRDPGEGIDEYLKDRPFEAMLADTPGRVPPEAGPLDQRHDACRAPGLADRHTKPGLRAA